jgi:spore coat protein CotF
VNRPYGAHEFLETQEALRSKAAHIELYGVMEEMAQDQQLKSILRNQQNRMMQSYQQGINLLQGKGVQVQSIPQPRFNVNQQPTVGIQNQMTQQIVPNMHPSRLSDQTIGTVCMNQHKMGAAVAMIWASECADPQLRTYHVTCANSCQEMAYELWQYLNAKGYYQVPVFPQQTMAAMAQSFQQQTQIPPSH